MQQKKDESTLGSQGNNNSGTIDFNLDLNDQANIALNTTGGFVNVLISNTALVIISLPGSSFVALSRICTHANCLVNYDEVSQKLPCPCHGSKFDLTGAVLNGPATKALVKYNVTQSGNMLRIFFLIYE